MARLNACTVVGMQTPARLHTAGGLDMTRDGMCASTTQILLNGTASGEPTQVLELLSQRYS
jgi:hypothetical protein